MSNHTPELSPIDGMIYVGPFRTPEEAHRASACVNALRGLDVAKVEALLDAVRARAELPLFGPLVACERANEVIYTAVYALADSIRAGGGE